MTNGYLNTGVLLSHRVKVERILGHKLPTSARIHHRDGNGRNNDNSNLIVCEDQQYHSLIELREAAYRTTGDATKRKCSVCRQYDSIDNMVHHLRYRRSQGSGQYYHSKCQAAYMRTRRQNNAS